MSRSDAKRQQEPGTACNKHPSLCHGLYLTWREKPRQLPWAGRGGGWARGALEHTHLGWGGRRCTSMPTEEAECSRIAPAAKIGAILLFTGCETSSSGRPLVCGKDEEPGEAPP